MSALKSEQKKKKNVNKSYKEKKISRQYDPLLGNKKSRYSNKDNGKNILSLQKLQRNRP